MTMKLTPSPIKAMLAGIIGAVGILAFKLIKPQSQPVEIYHIILSVLLIILFIFIPAILFVIGIYNFSFKKYFLSLEHYRNERPKILFRFFCYLAGLACTILIFRIIFIAIGLEA